MNSRYLSKKDGFTLLEVLISFVVLAFIGLAVYQAQYNTFRLRSYLMEQGDFFNTIRLSMTILERDIIMVYSPVMMVPQSNPNPSASGAPQGAPDPEMEQLLAGELGQTTKFWGPAIDKSAIRPSRFVGSEDKITFITASHIRVYKNTPETELAKVVYELKDDRRKESLGKILMKSHSPNVYEDDESKDKSTRVYPLIFGVTKLKYRYYRKDKDSWNTSWDTEGQDTHNLYPDMIEVTLEVKGPERLSFDGLYKFRREIPLHGLPATL